MPFSRSLALLLLAGAPLAAQTPAPTTPPRSRGTDIWIADLRRDGDALSLRRLRRVTNADGYHNQPVFTPDGRAILFSGVANATPNGPPDIYRYDVGTRHVMRLTSTPESEYSPAPAPGGVQFTVVRVERDSAQRLWRLDGEGLVVTPVLPRERRVAYYAWADTTHMAIALLDSTVGGPLSLFVAETGTGQLRPVSRNIGRSLQLVPGRGMVSFVQRDTGGVSWLSMLEPATRRTSRVTRLPEGGEHHAWLADGTVLVGTPRGLLMTTPGATASSWRAVELPEGTAALSVSRITISAKGDRIAFVAERR